MRDVAGRAGYREGGSADAAGWPGSDGSNCLFRQEEFPQARLTQSIRLIAMLNDELARIAEERIARDVYRRVPADLRGSVSSPTRRRFGLRRSGTLALRCTHL